MSPSFVAECLKDEGDENMGLIVFVWFFVVFLLVVSSYLLMIKSRFARFLRLCSVSAFLSTLTLVTVLHVLYSLPETNTVVLTKLYIFFLLCVSAFMIQFALAFPEFEKPKRSSLLWNIAYHAVGLVIIGLYVESFYWNALYGFKIASVELFGRGAIHTMIFLYVFASSMFMAVIFFHKIFSLQNLIFKQQSFLMFLSMLAVSIYWIFVYELFNIFSWAIVIQPLGYVVFMVLAMRACSLKMTFDKKQLFFGLVRFLVFNAIPAMLVGLITAYILMRVRSFRVQIVLLVVTAALSLLISNFIFYRLRRLLGDSREYQELLFKDLQRIDYTQGRKETAKEFSGIVEKYLEASNVDIMVVSDAGIFETAYSTLNNAYTYDSKNRLFDFIVQENISLLARNSVLVDAIYEEYRLDLLNLFNRTLAEIVIFLREGDKIIGLVAIGKKLAHQDYTVYDINILTEIYSFFFLIVYYLKNIAKEDVVITVDREIEMSDQIIGSIQKNMDVITGRHIDVSHVSYSAHQLGGDFIDFIQLPDDKYFFVIGDVSGKGLSASMSMVILKSTLRTFLIETRDFKELIVKVNTFIKKNLPRSTFFAGLFAILDLKENTMFYINCGIPLMSMYVDSYKNVIEIQGEGRVLGFVKDVRDYLKVRKIALGVNDVIVLTTDGLLDSSNLRDVKFGNERVNRLLLSYKNARASYIADEIYKNLLSFISAEIEDDVTMLVFKRNR